MIGVALVFLAPWALALGLLVLLVARLARSENKKARYAKIRRHHSERIISLGERLVSLRIKPAGSRSGR
ncbi:hypothetical protein BH20VER3_BH20VER3_03710 [soil metagenome]